jgi:tetratricopeptide (TPR) repeat protein
MRNMNAKNILVLLLIILIASCGRTPLNPTLVELEKMADTMPEVALDSLNCMLKDDLSRADKVYYDFLSVKLADKAIIDHTSDSIILPVIDYYSAHGPKERYAEALYYGGRVYHDIGDFPSAIEYYGEALNQIEGNKESLKLKGNILSQMSSLLNAMRLFNEARRYISMAIEVDKKLNDTVNLMYDLEVLGLNLMNSRNYDAAEHLFRKALNISNKKHHDAALWDSAHIAAVKNYKTEPDSAVQLIKNIPHKVMNVDKYNNDTRQLVYSYAADIYRCAGMPDSAYKYALELVKIKDAKNLKKGYAILLSDELKDLVPDDSIRAYVRHYKNAVESYMNSRGDANALIQNTQYNYSIVERDKQKALEKKRMIERWLALSVIVLLLAIIAVIYYRDKSNRTLIRLRSALDSSRELRKQLEAGDAKGEDSGQESESTSEVASEVTSEVEPEATAEDLRRQLIVELTAVCDSKKKRLPLSPEIGNSRAYAELQEYIKEKRAIPDTSPLWGELHSVIIEASPNFDRRLQLLSPGKIKTDAYRIMLLIKCGVTPTQLCVLIGRAKGTLSTRRRILGLRFTDSEISPTMFDNLVYAL